jgi:DNA-binding NarL/FixJ family response regulator
VRKIAEGETWLDHREVNWLIKAFRVQAAQLRTAVGRPVLTEKEMIVVSGVTQGLRNRDIAKEMGTTEQVVKNYLRKIYSKLNISDRLELALYTVNERLLEPDGVAARDSAAALRADSPQPAKTGRVEGGPAPVPKASAQIR